MRSIGTTGNLIQERDIATVLASRDFSLVLAFTAPQTVRGGSHELVALHFADSYLMQN